MTRIATLGNLGAMALAAAMMQRAEDEGEDWHGDAVALTPDDISRTRRAYTQTCNISEEERIERDRPKSRQERRQMERLRRKGRTT